MLRVSFCEVLLESKYVSVVQNVAPYCVKFKAGLDLDFQHSTTFQNILGKCVEIMRCLGRVIM